MSTPDEQAAALIAATGGRLHDGKAGRLLGLASRVGPNRAAYERALLEMCPGLDDELRAAVVAHLYPAEKPARVKKAKE